MGRKTGPQRRAEQAAAEALSVGFSQRCFIAGALQRRVGDFIGSGRAGARAALGLVWGVLRRSLSYSSAGRVFSHSPPQDEFETSSLCGQASRGIARGVSTRKTSAFKS